MEQKHTFRMLQDGEEVWRGKAYDAEHAEARFFDAWDESPGSLERFTLQRWGLVRVASWSWSRIPGWVNVYENQVLA